MQTAMSSPPHAHAQKLIKVLRGALLHDRETWEDNHGSRTRGTFGGVGFDGPHARKVDNDEESYANLKDVLALATLHWRGVGVAGPCLMGCYLREGHIVMTTRRFEMDAMDADFQNAQAWRKAVGRWFMCLALAHMVEITHGDLSPKNLLLGPGNGDFCIADWGSHGSSFGVASCDGASTPCWLPGGKEDGLTIDDDAFRSPTGVDDFCQHRKDKDVRNLARTCLALFDRTIEGADSPEISSLVQRLYLLDQQGATLQAHEVAVLCGESPPIPILRPCPPPLRRFVEKTGASIDQETIAAATLGQHQYRGDPDERADMLDTIATYIESETPDGASGSVNRSGGHPFGMAVALTDYLQDTEVPGDIANIAMTLQDTTMGFSGLPMRKTVAKLLVSGGFPMVQALRGNPFTLVLRIAPRETHMRCLNILAQACKQESWGQHTPVALALAALAEAEGWVWEGGEERGAQMFLIRHKLASAACRKRKSPESATSHLTDTVELASDVVTKVATWAFSARVRDGGVIGNYAAVPPAAMGDGPDGLASYWESKQKLDVDVPGCLKKFLEKEGVAEPTVQWWKCVWDVAGQPRYESINRAMLATLPKMRVAHELG